MTQGAFHMRRWLAVLALGLASLAIAYLASNAYADTPVTAIAHPGQPYCETPACDGPNDNPNYPPSDGLVDPAADDALLGKPVDPPMKGQAGTLHHGRRPSRRHICAVMARL